MCPSGQSWGRGFSLSYDLNLSDTLNTQLQKCVDETTTSEVFFKGRIVKHSSWQIIAQRSSDNRVKQLQGTKNLICQKPAGVSAHLINGQELEVVESSKHLGVTVTSNLSSIIQSTYLFLYANQTQQKLLSSWGVDKHALQTNRCKIVFTTVKNILRIINYVKCTRYS